MTDWGPPPLSLRMVLRPAQPDRTAHGALARSEIGLKAKGHLPVPSNMCPPGFKTRAILPTEGEPGFAVQGASLCALFAVATPPSSRLHPYSQPLPSLKRPPGRTRPRRLQPSRARPGGSMPSFATARTSACEPDSSAPRATRASTAARATPVAAGVSGMPSGPVFHRVRH